MLIYAVQDESGQWHTDPSTARGHVEDWFEGTLTVTEGPYTGRRVVRYASIEGQPARLR